MKNLILLTLLFSFNTHAENSRAPAVLDGSCNLNIPLTVKSIVDGKEVVKDRDIQEIYKEQCKEVKKCMNSASDEEMGDLKSLEAIACNNNLNAVTTRAPGPVNENKNFDGRRRSKNNPDQDTAAIKTDTPTAMPK